MNNLSTYLPQDRRRALASGHTLPDRTTGTALFADISGFTALTESLRDTLGSRRGIEALTSQINAVYTALIAEIERYGGASHLSTTPSPSFMAASGKHLH